MEFDARIGDKKICLEQNRIILGSFPTWSLTTPDPSKDETEETKRRARARNGDFLYYYGSAKNAFWHWYFVFVDSQIHEKDVNSIEASLNRNEIGIVNLIVACDRKEQSSFDYDLKNRHFNYEFFKYPEQGKTLKILCTSKTVLNEMLITNAFQKGHKDISQDLELTEQLKERINKTTGLLISQTHPIARVLKVKNGGVIECVSLPSPGSPYRGLDYFGKPSGISSKEFLRKYLSSVFSWFGS